MKALSRVTFLFAFIVLTGVYGLMAQRVFKGTVYMDGKPAAGVTVEAHKGSTMMTSFDGKYEVTGDSKSKYIKFTLMATNESKKFDLDERSVGEIDFAFTGVIPGAEASTEEVTSGDLNLKSDKELLEEQNKEFMTEYSLYTEFYKQEDFKSALPHWKVLINKYPKSTSNLYIHGAKMYEALADEAKTDEEIDKYLNEVMKYADQRIKYFGGEGFVLGRKGTVWLKYKLDERRKDPIEGEELKEVMLKGYEWLNTSVDIEKGEAELPVFLLLMQTTRSLFKLGSLPKEQVVLNYEKSSKYLNEIITKSSTDKEKVKIAMEIQAYIETLFSTSGAADCEALVSIFSPQFEEKNSDIEFIKSMLRKLRQAKCESELVEKATTRLYELEPSAEAAFNMARGYLKQDNMEMAKKYYQQAIEQETDPKLLATYYYERGLLLYIRESNYPEAREMARKAISLDSDLCDANMLIGDIYATSAKNFNGTNLEKSAIFWVAVDYYNKARKGDCAAEAANKASDYRKYFPNKEEAFMEGLQAGQSYKVGGWINETTTIRF